MKNNQIITAYENFGNIFMNANFDSINIIGGRFFLFLNVFINNTFKDILLGLIIMEDFIDSYKFEIILKYADLLC